jgi:hypothetical protein
MIVGLLNPNLYEYDYLVTLRVLTLKIKEECTNADYTANVHTAQTRISASNQPPYKTAVNSTTE